MDELTNCTSPAAGGWERTACPWAFAFLLKTELTCGLGGALPEGSSYCELSSLRVTVTSWIFTSISAELQLPLSPSAGLGGRPGELGLTEDSLESWAFCWHILTPEMEGK